MSDIKASLPLRGSTALDSLQARFGALGDDNLKIRAYGTGNGTATLFATDRATGFWGQLTGLSRERDTARSALEGWFKEQYGPKLSAEARQVMAQHISTGELTVGRLKALMQAMEDLGPPAPNYIPAPPPTFADGIPRDGKLNGNRLELGGTDYKMGKRLGSGGFGDVFLATAADGSRIAVKQLKSNADPAEAKKEFEAHLRALGDGTNCSHIVALKGAITDAAGQVCGIATELMAGDAIGAIEAIDDAERTGRIHPTQGRELRLTILKDMATGLAQLHEGGGVMHRDVKPENFLISHDGVTKIADFGSVAPEAEQRGMTLLGGGTIVYMAPEGLDRMHEVHDLARQVDKLQRKAAMAGSAQQRMQAETQVKQLTAEIDTRQVTHKADIFSLGLTAYATLESKLIGDTQSQAERRIGGLGIDNEKVRTNIFRQMYVHTDIAEDKLIRSMLAAKPEDRPSAAEVAKMPPLDEPGVGTPEARKLLSDVMAGRI
jgi:serine/threonine protein kinase